MSYERCPGGFAGPTSPGGYGWLWVIHDLLSLMPILQKRSFAA
jgi:hypothetical protein